MVSSRLTLLYTNLSLVADTKQAKLPVAVNVDLNKLRDGDMKMIEDLEVFKGTGELVIVSSGYSTLKSLGVELGKKGVERVDEDHKLEQEAAMWFVKSGFSGVVVLDEGWGGVMKWCLENDQCEGEDTVNCYYCQLFASLLRSSATHTSNTATLFAP